MVLRLGSVMTWPFPEEIQEFDCCIGREDELQRLRHNFCCDRKKDELAVQVNVNVKHRTKASSV